MGPIPEPNAEPALKNFAIEDGSFQCFLDDDFGEHRDFFSQWRFLLYGYFPRLAWGRFTLRPKKTGFFLERIKRLGFVLQGEGLRPSEDKVASIRDYPTPQKLDKVERFLWMTTYLRHFIPGRADHAIVLKEAAKMESKEEWDARDPGKKHKNGRTYRGPRRVLSWSWGERQDKSFAANMEAVIERAVYGGNDHRQYHLATDASKTGMGCVLFQLIDCEPGTRITAANRKHMRIIMFISLRLEGPELRYSTTEQEALAVWRCLKEVDWLVQGSTYPVLVHADHSALIHLLKGDDAHGKLAWWQQKLSEFDIEYVHIPGSQNAIADGLSRMPAHYFQTSSRTTDPIEGKGKKGKGDTGKEKEKKEEESPEGEVPKITEKKEEEQCEKEENEEEGREGRTMEVLAVGDGEEEEWGQKGVEGRTRKQNEVWDLWEDSEWYGELVRYLL